MSSSPSMPRALALLGASVVLLASCFGSSRLSEPPLPMPLGLQLYFPIPEDNPMTPARVALGRRLFFDPLLSRDSSVSCASCHRPELAFADSATRSMGVERRSPPRNTPSLLNVNYRPHLTWDGSSVVLEEQVLKPIQNPLEMDLPPEVLITRLESDRDYADSFGVAIGSVPTMDGVAQALSAYLRSLRSGNSPADRFIHGQPDALSAEAQLGFRIFVGKARCGTCHAGVTFSDGEFHNTGGTVRSRDSGRFGVTGSMPDRGAFLTPSLRNVSVTAPYMHDGGLTTLDDVIDFYNNGGLENPNLSPRIRPLGLLFEEKRALIAFLRALEGDL